MANQPGRRQPFRFWHWVRPTPTSRPPPSPTGRPAARAPPGAPPPSAATPPPSRRPSPATSRSPSPTQEASPPRKEAATQEVSHAPSLSTPPLSRPESPTKKPVEPETEDSRPTVRALSPTTEQQEQSLSETAAQPPEAGNQTTQVSEPETVPVDTVRGTTPTQNLVLETEPSSQMGQELSMQISQPPQVEGKSKVEPELIEETQTSQIPQGEEKPEGTKNDEPKTKPGAQPAEKSTLSSDEPKDRAEIKSSMAEPDSEAPGPHADTGEPVTKPRSSVKQINVNDSKGRESTMGTRTIPWASPSHGDRASFHKEIDEGISKLVQKLKLGQSQQQGSESAVSIITLAGKNNGATMFLGQETTKKESDLHINKKAEASSGNKEIQKQMLSHTDSENPAITASINSNVQGINNSLLHESSCSEEDAGVHLALSIKPHQPAKSK